MSASSNRKKMELYHSNPEYRNAYLERNRRYRETYKERRAEIDRIRRTAASDSLREAHKKWCRKNKDRLKSYNAERPIQRACYNKVEVAVKAGRLRKQPCGFCGTSAYVHAHHEDYEQPLKVTWLCPSCHSKRHRVCR